MLLWHHFYVFIILRVDRKRALKRCEEHLSTEERQRTVGEVRHRVIRLTPAVAHPNYYV